MCVCDLKDHFSSDGERAGNARAPLLGLWGWRSAIVNGLHVDNKAQSPALVIQGQGWDWIPAEARPAMGKLSNSLTQSLTLLLCDSFLTGCLCWWSEVTSRRSLAASHLEYCNHWSREENFGENPHFHDPSHGGVGISSFKSSRALFGEELLSLKTRELSQTTHHFSNFYASCSAVSWVSQQEPS